MSANMGLFPARKCVERIQEAFPTNAEVELEWMDDIYRHMPPGTKGTVSSVDDAGNIHVRWESGVHLSAVWNADVVRNVNTGVKSNEFWDDDRPAASL